MKIAAVIPTKNRPILLLNAIKSIYRQHFCPCQIVVIDQTEDSSSKKLVDEFLKDIDQTPKKITLIYIHDAEVSGLVAAKAHSIQYVKADFVSFLDDDVELPPDYFNNVKRFFEEYPDVYGVSGVVQSKNPKGFFNLFFFELFHIGSLRDERRRAELASSRIIIKSRNISGGISTYKKEVLENVKFIPSNNMFAFEDIEFSWRVNDYYGLGSTCIDTGIKIDHLLSNVNRANLRSVWERKITEIKNLYKLRAIANENYKYEFYWLLIGEFIYATLSSVRHRTVDPFMGALSGFRKTL